MSYEVFFSAPPQNAKRMIASDSQVSGTSGPALRLACLIALVFFLSVFPVFGQDWVRTGTSLGVEKVRLAIPDFKASTTDPQNAALLKTFNDTFWNDMDNSGVVELVSKSFYPLQVPGVPADVTFGLWNAPPPNAAMLAFGNLGASGGKVTVQGWLYDVKNTSAPQVLGKQYSDVATDDAVRLIAHKFADEIILRLGGGIPGIAESKIFFVSNRSGHKEIWAMDYDGSNQRQLTHLGSISLSPRISPDGSRLAFSSLVSTGWEIKMYSFDLSRLVSFPHFGGTNLSPAWSPDGTLLALAHSHSGDSEIYLCDSNGANLHRMTAGKGPDVSPAWNRKTGGQIAFVSGRTGLPQIYTMEADGTNQTRMTDQGYAVSPNWSPNGQFLTFAWVRKYGPGEPGSFDIYLMDIASKQWVQLTHDGGHNDFPSWAPDGRHIVFESSRSGKPEIWEMLADGTKLHQLTFTGHNSQPNWSWK
ncbi:MAG TPA: Tol-Pal system beta propeller repeat protein TolB [Candidatus Aquilonibacter sp.]|nr:Tol-Pal system beta propeller repeat protein TolB [Candidatus Aquilonibacter sp.]